MGLDLTEEELEGLDGGDLNWATQQAEPGAPASTPTPPQQLTTGDLVVDRLIALGHQQGYVDIADIMADFEDPEAEAARIEEIGQRLHDAQIEIRDGDEVIDMDADYEEDQDGSEPPEQTDVSIAAPDISSPATPTFPARDLDLATDDDDRLGLAEADATAPDTSAQPRSDEPNMTPFSLSDLGLSDDEINALGLEEPAAPAVPSTPPAEPDLTPFSLSELGLSDEEITSLGLGEPAAAPEPPAPAEPELTPFSLSELGLSEDEIAAFNLGDATVASPSEPAAGELAEPAPDRAPEQPVPTPPATQPMLSEEIPAPTQAATPPRRAAAPASRSADTEAPIYTGNDIVDGFLHQLEADPQNDLLRISLARIGWQIGIPDLAVQQYKYLIKHNRALDQVVDEIHDLLSDGDEQKLTQRLHRTLGDVYTKQGRFREAIEEYSWTGGGPRSTR
jgi:hypothetical protein